MYPQIVSKLFTTAGHLKTLDSSDSVSQNARIIGVNQAGIFVLQLGDFDALSPQLNP